MRSASSFSFALIAAALSLAPLTRAGGVDSRNNNSADFIRTLSRNSSLDGGDIAIYNPAGTVRLEDGLHLALHNQTISKYNKQTLQRTGLDFESEITTPFYPTAFVVYKRTNWTAFGAFSFPGGGGALHYDEGSNTAAIIQANLQFMQPSRDADSRLSSVYYAMTLGGAWAPMDKFSVSLAVRPLYARTDVEVDADTLLGSSSKIVDHMEEARGFTGILGADFFPTPELTLALRLEGPTTLEWEVQRSTLNLDQVILDPTVRAGFTSALRGSLRAPGEEFRRDLPANLGLGAGYAANTSLRADLSFNYYFNTWADWEGKDQDHDDGWEVSLGLEYAWNVDLKTSVGGLYTVTGADPESYNAENPALNSYTLGLGARYTLDRFAFVGAFAANIALDDEAEVVTPAGTSFVDLEKHVLLYAVALEYRAF